MEASEETRLWLLARLLRATGAGSVGLALAASCGGATRTSDSRAEHGPSSGGSGGAGGAGAMADLEAFEAHGRLSPREARAVALQAIERVVRSAAAALLERDVLPRNRASQAAVTA